MPNARLTSWDEATAEKICNEVFDGGWSRSLPHTGTFLLLGVAILQRECTEEDLACRLRSADDTEGSFDAPCWEPPDLFTDEGLAEQNAEWDDDDGRTAAEVNAEIEAHHKAWVATVDRYAAHYGLGPVRANRDALDLLVAAGAIHRNDGRLSPAFPLPRVEDVFPVSGEERELLAKMRAESVQMRAEQRRIASEERAAQSP